MPVIGQFNYPDDAPAEVLNEAALRSKAQTALAANSTFLAITSPSNTQTLAQVRTLTRECNAIIRLLIDQLDSTVDT